MKVLIVMMKIITKTTTPILRKPLDGLLNKLKARKKLSTPDKGVLYIGRVPPYMKPPQMKHLLSQYGHVTKIYLTPEDPEQFKRRKKAGGKRKEKFIDGWVEYADKRIAKAVAKALNNSPMSASKRKYYAEDLWNLKYLPDFTWTNLTEKKVYESRVRNQKLRTQISHVKRENNEYLEAVEKSRAKQFYNERQAKKQKLVPDDDINK